MAEEEEEEVHLSPRPRQDHHRSRFLLLLTSSRHQMWFVRLSIRTTTRITTFRTSRRFFLTVRPRRRCPCLLRIIFLSRRFALRLISKLPCASARRLSRARLRGDPGALGLKSLPATSAEVCNLCLLLWRHFSLIVFVQRGRPNAMVHTRRVLAALEGNWLATTCMIILRELVRGSGVRRRPRPPRTPLRNRSRRHLRG